MHSTWVIFAPCSSFYYVSIVFNVAKWGHLVFVRNRNALFYTLWRVVGPSIHTHGCSAVTLAWGLYESIQSNLSIIYLAEEVEIGQVLAGIQYLAVEEVNSGHWLDMETDHLTVMYQWVGQILQKIYCGYHWIHTLCNSITHFPFKQFLCANYSLCHPQSTNM